METEALRQSGILESYALGMASPEEVAQVEAALATNPEVAAVLEEIQQALAGLAEPLAPRPGLKDHIWAKLSNEIAHTDMEIKVASSMPANPLRIAFQRRFGHVPSETEANLFQRQRFMARMSMAASMAFFLMIGLEGYYGWQLHSKDQALMTRQAAELQQQKAHSQMMDLELALIKDPNTMTVPLAGMEMAPKASAHVMWNKTTNKLYIADADMPPPPPGKQYQLWAIKGETKMDAGLLPMHDMPPIAELKAMGLDSADLFAITLEDAGNGPIPHGPIYMVGKVKAG